MPVTAQPNQLQAAPPPEMGGGNQLMPPGTQAVQSAAAQAPQEQMTPQRVAEFHQNLDDMQTVLKELIRLPNDELTQKRVLGAASDLITAHQLSRGKRGASAMEVATELASPDFPKDKPNGDKPTAIDLRKYLINHFTRLARVQATLTTKFGPPMPANPQQAPNPTSHLANTQENSPGLHG